MPRKKKITRLQILEEEQVLLSKERTVLSFMRTGLAFITAGVAIVGFFQTLQLAQMVGYILVGIGFVEVFESIRRLVEKQRELDELRSLS
jgi:uncharacterized membrane protein YidH (DUF202 family)